MKLRVVSRANPNIGVPSTILRKKPATPVEDLGVTNGKGEITVFDTDCIPTTSYRAVSTQQAIFPDGKPDWKPCFPGKPIEISIVSSGLSAKTEAFITNGIPADWKVPVSYEKAVGTLLAAQEEEQWGVAAKLGSQLSYQFRAAGLSEEALVFGEISMASTVIYALKESDAVYSGMSILDNSQVGYYPKLSEETKLAVTKFQAACGAEPDGNIGWKTMSCLPGGNGYKLPSEILLPISGSTRGGF